MADHAHPLFLNENNEEPPEVGFIHIIRWENGKKLQVAKAFTGEELQSLDQIKEMFGGGSYELIARDFNNRISRRIRVNLAGKSKPLETEPEPDDDEEENNSRNYSAPAVAVNPFPIEGVMGMFMHSMTTQMQMQQAQQAQQMQMQMAQAEAARQASADQMKMMMAMMTANKQDMTPILLAVMQNSAEMFKVLLTKGGGMGSSEILEAIQIGTNLVKGAQEGASGQKTGSVEELIATFLGTLQQMKQMPPGVQLPPGMVPPGFAQQQQAPQQQAPQQQAPQQYPPQGFMPEQQAPAPTPGPRRRRVVQVAPEPANNEPPENTAGVAEVG